MAITRGKTRQASWTEAMKSRRIVNKNSLDERRVIVDVPVE
jgi:hypothetical protein